MKYLGYKLPVITLFVGLVGGTAIAEVSPTSSPYPTFPEYYPTPVPSPSYVPSSTPTPIPIETPTPVESPVLIEIPTPVGTPIPTETPTECSIEAEELTLTSLRVSLGLDEFENAEFFGPTDYDIIEDRDKGLSDEERERRKKLERDEQEYFNFYQSSCAKWLDAIKKSRCNSSGEDQSNYRYYCLERKFVRSYWKRGARGEDDVWVEGGIVERTESDIKAKKREFYDMMERVIRGK